MPDHQNSGQNGTSEQGKEVDYESAKFLIKTKLNDHFIATGETRKDFCNRHQIPYNSLSAWVNRDNYIAPKLLTQLLEIFGYTVLHQEKEYKFYLVPSDNK